LRPDKRKKLSAAGITRAPNQKKSYSIPTKRDIK
jgi:hypothetical protein